MIIPPALFALVAFLAFALFVLWLKQRKLSKSYQQRFASVIDADEETRKVKLDKALVQQETQKLQDDYKVKRNIYEELRRVAAVYDDTIEMAELGFYEPQFDFNTSEKYKEKITNVKQAQKTLIKGKVAIVCSTKWTVEGSASKGKTMTNRGIRLTARAFNNECDAATAGVRWNNVSRMVDRITRAYEAINKLNETNVIHIEYDYLQLKLDELRLTHEYREKKQVEKEEQAEIRRRIREETKLQHDLENSLKEEGKYQKLLDKAKKEAEKASGEKLEQLRASLEKLSRELEEAKSKSERARSMAEQTRSGHVYVISNLGSFGEGVYKIGMTRRLEPLDRVQELGDASVPFVFDVHALIYSKDAPSLESALHRVFNADRLNLVNNRKEFFNVKLEDIEAEVLKLDPSAEFVVTAEARQYRESMSIRALRDEALRLKEKENFPMEI